jgi:large repetitive protein
MLVVAPPAIAALSPLSGPANATRNVTITGSGFAPGATVSFGGLSAPLTFVNNPTSINTFAPAHSPGTVDVVVTSGGATATVHGFTYGAPDLAPPPRLPGAAGNYPDPLPPSRGGPTGGMPDALPVPRPLFP